MDLCDIHAGRLRVFEGLLLNAFCIDKQFSIHQLELEHSLQSQVFRGTSWLAAKQFTDTLDASAKRKGLLPQYKAYLEKQQSRIKHSGRLAKFSALLYECLPLYSRRKKDM